MKKYLALCIALLVFLSQNAFAEEPAIIEFKTQPDSITTNISAFPVTGRAAYTTNAVFVNDIAVDLTGGYFFEIVDLLPGPNTITLKLVDQNGSQEIYSKQIIFEPAYSTADKELVYANIDYNSPDGREHGVIVADITDNAFLGIWKEKEIYGITKDGSEIIITPFDGTQQHGLRYSTKSNSSTGRRLPSYISTKPVFSNDGKKVYYRNYKVDLAANSIDGNLPITIWNTAAMSDDDKKLFFYDGYVDLQTNTFFARNYWEGIIATWGDLAVDSSGSKVLTSSFGWARGNANILDADTNKLLVSFTGADYARNIVVSPDKKKAYFGFYGNPDWGRGGIIIVDITTFSSDNWFGLNGAGSLAIANTGKIYASAHSDIIGIAELTPIDGGKNLKISKAFLVRPYYVRIIDKWMGDIFYKAGTSIACSSNSQCGTDSWTGTQFCDLGNVYQDYITNTCNNPGTPSSSCSSSTATKLKQTCAYGCSNGACNAPPVKPASTGNIRVVGRKLLVDGNEFEVKSIGYAPVPIGENPGQPPYYDVTVHPELTARDFPLLRAMGANAIRTWGKVNSTVFLDAAWNSGNKPIRVIMGYWMGSERDYQNATVRQAILADFNAYVRAYKNHPAVLIWAIGNEENWFYAQGNNDKHKAYFSLVNEMAKNAYQIEGSKYHPVMAIALEMPGSLTTVGNAGGGADDASLNFVDVWGINHYPGKIFGTFFTDFAAKSNKPLLITEYGIDALDNSTGAEYEATQAEWDVALWREIAAADIAIGGSLMEYSDEWWKDWSGNVATHDLGGYGTSSHPDGFSNEEWWGIMRVQDNGSSPDIMIARQAYYALQREFGGSSSGLLHLVEMPSYEKLRPHYSGAAAAQMILNYIRTGAGYPNLDQDEIYSYARQYNNPVNSSLQEMDAEAMAAVLGHFDPYDSIVSNRFDSFDSLPDGNPYQGYNFFADTYYDIDEFMQEIAHWMAYPVTREEWWLKGALVARPNTPATTPLYGSYGHWVAINGFAASNNPLPQPHDNPWNTVDVAIYGFWLTDPAANGIGKHVFVTADDAAAIYFKPVDSNDSYNSKYLQVAEPPTTPPRGIMQKMGKSKAGKVKIAKPIVDQGNLQFIGVKEKALLEKKSWRDIVDPNLLTDKEAVAAFEGAVMGKPLQVHDLQQGNYYYLVPFNKKGLTAGVIMLDAAQGYFKQASWTAEPTKYLPIAEAKAISIVKREILKENKGKRMQFGSAKAGLEWKQGSYSQSPFSPYWEIEIGNEKWVVTQEGKAFKESENQGKKPVVRQRKKGI